MLEVYQNSQPLAYKILKNELSKNEHSHAYLLEANGYKDTLGLAKALAKSLFCVNSSDKEKICNLIDEDNFPEFKIISPDGLIIKKETIDELKADFSKKPLYSDKKIYIINGAEKMNTSSANALLKFLEEPEQDIIAILITNNIYEMLQTIVSRCQIISLRENKQIDKNHPLNERIMDSINITKEYFESIFDDEKCLTKCIDFVNYYEKYNLDAYIHINNLWFETYKEKEQFIIAFKIMTLYYIDILKKMCSSSIDIFYEYEDKMGMIIKNNNIDTICNKIKILTNLEKKISENNNLNLIMDKLLILFERGETYGNNSEDRIF